MLRTYTLIFALIVGSFIPSLSTAQTAQAAPANAAGQTMIDVRITGIRNTSGQIVLYLWDAPDGFPTRNEKDLKALTLAAKTVVGGVVTATFAVRAGTYAVTVLHDENGNGKMDANLLGIPKEGYGASNNPVTHFHAPSFDQAKFQVPASGQQITIAMRY